MNRSKPKSLLPTLVVLGALALLPIAIALPGHSTPKQGSSALSDPWTPAQTASAAFLASQIQQKDVPAPVIVYVGVRTLYNGGHIPGAVFHGPGSTPQGIEDLKKFAETLPKDSDIVLYCGCCPLDRCPNIRPAFTALDKLGFTRVRVLILPTSFAADWAEKGYPVEKSSPAAN